MTSSSATSIRNRASSSSSSSSSSPPAAARPFDGFTSSGESFHVPETLNTIQTLLPWNWSITSLIVISSVLFSFLSVVLFGWSKWPHIFIFFFFRLAYNVGLGVILRGQSEKQKFTKFYSKWLKSAGGIGSQHWIARLFHHLSRSQLADQTLNVDEFPESFRAWLVYKNIVNIILINDGMNYLILGIKCFHFPPNYGFLVLLQYALAFFLAIFNYWAKLDAHRAIGEYSWYWGDFFFRKDQTLTFDGIFELFPHPMYTVGYSLYYGYSLFTRSYTMLFVSLIAHVLQLAFLFIVEEPHIERTYGKPQSFDEQRLKVLYDPATGLFPNKQDPIFVFNLRWHRAADIALVLLVLYSIFFSFVIDDRYFLIIQVVVWRGLHWLGLGALLWSQSRLQFWTRLYERRGRTLFEAFSNWKTLYNMSLTLNLVVFICCGLRYSSFAWANFTDPSYMASLVLGLVLIALSLWSSYSTYSSVGEFGWFYGDFFIHSDALRHDLCYTGIYRFLNNPDCVTGYAGQYGLALISQSWAIAGLALFSQVMNFIFLNVVELPHMHKLYSAPSLRPKAPIEGAIERVASEVSSLVPDAVKQKAAKHATQYEAELKHEIRRVRVKALSEVYDVYKKLRKSSDAAGAPRGGDKKKEAIKFKVNGKHVVGQSLELNYRIMDDQQVQAPTDWIGLYPVDVPSQPGASDGHWMYVQEGQEGENKWHRITFPATRQPTKEGIYEVRYHTKNEYKILGQELICFTENEEEE